MTRMVRIAYPLNYCQKYTDFYSREISDFLTAYSSNIEKIFKSSETLNQLIGQKSRICFLDYAESL